MGLGQELAGQWQRLWVLGRSWLDSGRGYGSRAGAGWTVAEVMGLGQELAGQWQRQRGCSPGRVGENRLVPVTESSPSVIRQ